MSGAEVLIPVLVPIAAFAMVFGIFYLKTRENMAMIEKNMNPKRYANRPAPFRSLKSGLLFLGGGLGLLIAFILDNNMDGKDQEIIYFALLAIGGGLGLIGSYSVEKKEWIKDRDNVNLD